MTTGDSFFHWVINAGHGMQQSGKKSPSFLFNGVDTVFQEWWANYHTAMILGEMLKEAGISFSCVNPHPDQVGQWLHGPGSRMYVANDLARNAGKPAIYVSIHYNSLGDGRGWPKPPGDGVEVLVPALKTSSDPSKVKSHWMGHNLTEAGRINVSAMLGRTFAAYITASTGLDKRHPKEGGTVARNDLAELNSILVPGVMTENGFFDNRQEVLKLHDPEFRKLVAEGHFMAILETEAAGKTAPEVFFQKMGIEPQHKDPV